MADLLRDYAFAGHVAMAAGSASVATSLSHPLDTFKTLLQVSAGPKQKLGLLQVAERVRMASGRAGIYNGLGWSILSRISGLGYEILTAFYKGRRRICIKEITVPFYFSSTRLLHLRESSSTSAFPTAMASADLEIKAKEAFMDDDFDRAVDLYSQAIDLDPGNACLYADRAQANIKLKNYTEAVADATKAIELDSSMAKAYFRKGAACFELEEYQTAKAALETGLALTPWDSRFTKLIKECDEHIAEETGILPEKLATPTIQPTILTTPEDANSSSSTHGQTKEVAKKPKYRHDYYNTPTEVVITFFAKGIPANNVSVDFGEQILSVEISSNGEEKYHFQSRLFGKIIPDKCKYQVLLTKIEVRLLKAETITWTSLEYNDKKAVPQKINTLSAAKGQRPSYPSSKSKVDWDKLEAQVKKEEKEEKLDGDAALNKFFKDIYSDANEDMRRAMSKSFVESNGTVLSTNWKEVGSKKVEGSPPDGMEMKKWEY